jgi:Flp pilus assembly protein CpaB
LDNGLAAGANGSATESRPRRGFASRVSREQRLALAAGLVAFVLALSVLRDRSETVTVAVARAQIPAATAVTPAMVRGVEVPANSPIVDSLVPFDQVQAGEWTTTRSLAPGEPIGTAALSTDVPDNGLRSMSLPVAREHAAGGALRPGDRVDVIDVVNGEVSYAATNAEVLAVNDETAGSVGARPTTFTVTVAVDSAAALRLASALADDKLEIVRSTGAAPVLPGTSISGGAGGG